MAWDPKEYQTGLVLFNLASLKIHLHTSFEKSQYHSWIATKFFSKSNEIYQNLWSENGDKVFLLRVWCHGIHHLWWQCCPCTQPCKCTLQLNEDRNWRVNLTPRVLVIPNCWTTMVNFPNHLLWDWDHIKTEEMID